MLLLLAFFSLNLYAIEDENTLPIQTNYGSINRDEFTLQEHLGDRVAITIENPLHNQSVWESRKKRLKESALKIAAWGGGSAICLGFGSYNAHQLINYGHLEGLTPTIVWFSSSIVFSITTGLTLYRAWHGSTAE